MIYILIYIDIYLYKYTHTHIHVPGPLTTVFFLRALRNLKHLEKIACQNHDFESLRNATRTHKKTTPALKKTTQIWCHVKTAQICFLIFRFR